MPLSGSGARELVDLFLIIFLSVGLIVALNFFAGLIF